MLLKKRFRSLQASAIVLLAAMSVLASVQPARAQLFGVEEKEDPTQKPTADTVWDKKMLDRLDRDVRKLERSVQRVENKSAPPVLIEPDPEVVALQATVSQLSVKLDEQTQTITRLTGQAEEANHKLAQQNQTNTALLARLDTLTKRLDLAEAHIADIDKALAPPPPLPKSTGNADTDFDQAFDMLNQNKLDDADRAFQAFIQTWPEAPQLAEAWFHLGQVRLLKNDTSGAVAALATSLKGWPQKAWAPEATVKLANALLDSNSPKEACGALSEFNRRYVTLASSATRVLAKSLRTKAKCTGKD